MRALGFHHIQKEDKEFSISRRIRSWARVKKELKKCILVCSNCHSEIHEGLIDAKMYARSSNTAERTADYRQVTGSIPVARTTQVSEV